MTRELMQKAADSAERPGDVLLSVHMMCHEAD